MTTSNNRLRVTILLILSAVLLACGSEKGGAAGGGTSTFGYAVAVSGNTALVSGSSGIYVYTREGNTWQHQALLAPRDRSRNGSGMSVGLT